MIMGSSGCLEDRGGRSTVAWEAHRHDDEEEEQR
jgi:hypothetical protein